MLRLFQGRFRCALLVTVVVAALCGPGLSAEVEAASLLGQHIRLSRLLFMAEPYSVTFEVTEGVEVEQARSGIDVSEDRIVFFDNNPTGGGGGGFELPFVYLQSYTYEFELLDSQLFASASFDEDLSTFSGDLDGRIEVDGSILRVLMSGLGRESGDVLIIDVQVVPEPASALLAAVALSAVVSLRAVRRLAS